MKRCAAMIELSSLDDFKEKTADKDNYWLFLYKENLEQSICAKQSIATAIKEAKKELVVFAADVAKVKDIHPVYSVNSVPTLLKFEQKAVKGIYKGCNEAGFYESLLNDSFFSVSNPKSENAQKSVTVYSTPTCSWCTRLKTYLRENNIKFRDIDVSKDQKAAEEMVKRSGQQGVPQSLIGGQVIVGFDKAKIDKLLNLQS